MKKTLKTVLITLAATFVFLIIIIMIFGEDTPKPTDGSSQESKKALSEQSINDNENSSKEVAKISSDVYTATIGYDIFDWNMADEQGKIDIVNNIIKVWNESGSSCEMTDKELVEYINLNLSDQANIFEVACIAAQIDPLPYLNSNN